VRSFTFLSQKRLIYARNTRLGPIAPPDSTFRDELPTDDKLGLQAHTFTFHNELQGGATNIRCDGFSPFLRSNFVCKKSALPRTAAPDRFLHLLIDEKNGVPFRAHKRNDRADEHHGDGKHVESILHEEKKESEEYDDKQRRQKQREKRKRSGSKEG
jgi:hypothetical protein